MNYELITYEATSLKIKVDDFDEIQKIIKDFPIDDIGSMNYKKEINFKKQGLLFGGCFPKEYDIINNLVVFSFDYYTDRLFYYLDNWEHLDDDPDFSIIDNRNINCITILKTQIESRIHHLKNEFRLKEVVTKIKDRLKEDINV